MSFGFGLWTLELQLVRGSVVRLEHLNSYTPQTNMETHVAAF